MHKQSSIRPLEERDLLRILAWRNHPQIRSGMLRQHEISLNEHKAWFLEASKDKARRLLIVEELGEPIGFVQFKGVMQGGSVEWGFYIEPSALKGSGRKLGIAALNYAFTTLNVHKICGQVLQSNEASLKFHIHMGFTQEGILREQFFINGKYISMICFGLIVNEWKELSFVNR